MSKALQGFETIETDFVGPIGAGNSFFLVFVDAATGMIWAYHSMNNRDESVLQGLQKLRDANNGLSSRIICDNAILVPTKEGYKYLEAHGVQVLHGMALDSRCLSRVERSISDFLDYWANLLPGC
jgi:hypothetical protein